MSSACPDGPVVSEEAAIAMAEGACRVLDADVGLALTGVAGPTEQDGQPVGTLFVGLSIEGASRSGASPPAGRPRPDASVRRDLLAEPAAASPARARC